VTEHITELAMVDSATFKWEGTIGMEGVLGDTPR